MGLRRTKRIAQGSREDRSSREARSSQAVRGPQDGLGEYGERAEYGERGEHARSDAAVELRGVRRQYGRGSATVHALRGIDLTLPRGSFTAVMGPSGSGKSTFLQCAAGLDRPTEGSVRLGGTEITGMSENKLTELRRSRLGFVFQAFNLLPSLTVEQNIVLPMRLDGRRTGSAAARRSAADMLTRVGLGDKGDRRPGQLSGGQQQRVAIARALVTRPDVVFADEPTGALDTTTAAEILALLRHAVDSLGATVVMVTHDPAAAAWADRVLFLADGEIADSLPHATAERIAARMTALTAPAHAHAHAGAAA
ncbi:ABC transporter ATP-binding protein [Streptomyces sp. BE147]|uniref:ABC transporter ATP-binding protein n=1 Tax=Streptomyces sp. BE147 TaxID=3002524 RepID=UPI002E7A248F|nr:ABC transporter ATP-binding protein [Streptomyces sp. BE147]MEE1739249.1 ABC transporter ATP-binding protein [Streptomyces sp. BE147]